MANRLHEILTERGISTLRFAEMMNVGRRTALKWRSGLHKPGEASAALMEKLLGLPIDELFVGAPKFKGNTELQRYMRRQGLTVAAFRELTGASPATINQWRMGRSVPMRHHRAALLSYMGEEDFRAIFEEAEKRLGHQGKRTAAAAALREERAKTARENKARAAIARAKKYAAAQAENERHSRYRKQKEERQRQGRKIIIPHPNIPKTFIEAFVYPGENEEEVRNAVISRIKKRDKAINSDDNFNFA